jgi:2-amino-4-hydroxy-6-hydroxymethyldihydropteridine diphosphokinase
MKEVTFSYIALGGNLGDVRESFKCALRSFHYHPDCISIRCSRLYETEPWGEPDQPKYLNLVAELEWSGSAKELAEFGFQIEKEAGRDRENEKRWGPRPLDIDLLFHRDVILNSETLTIPHPRISQRKFVLIPLLDLITPSVIPPTWNISLIQSFDKCDDSGEVVQLSENLWEDWQE